MFQSILQDDNEAPMPNLNIAHPQLSVMLRERVLKNLQDKVYLEKNVIITCSLFMC